MKKNILLIAGILGCLMFAGAFSLSSAVSAEESKLMPMELDGTEWTIELAISTTKDGTKKMQEDTLVFKDKKFNTTGQEKGGFDPSNYSLKVNEDDVTSFGTMQIKDEKTAFWEGKVTGEKVKGSVHVQYPSGDNITQSYVGQLSKGVLKRKSNNKPEEPEGE